VTWRTLSWLLGVLCLNLTGCAKDYNTVVEADGGKEAPPATIDQDPWAVLPAGAVGWLYLDAQQLFASRFGPTLLQVVERRTPFLPDAGVDSRRDVLAFHLGAYSIQGLDFVGVVHGNFDPATIAASAEKNPVTPLGVRLTLTSYGGRTLYMAEELGFTPVTNKTLLVGNQMGMRRAIDRIRTGKLKREIPAWLEKQLGTGAPIVMSLNLKQSPVSNATRQQLAFLQGMATLGLLGNFQDPGLNLAGTAGYGSAAEATRGAENLEALTETIQSVGGLLAWIGVAQPLRQVRSQVRETDVQFVAEVDGLGLDSLLSQVDRFLPTPPGAPLPAPVTPTPTTPPPGAPGAP
jgi:hypothetical protein